MKKLFWFVLPFIILAIIISAYNYGYNSGKQEGVKEGINYIKSIMIIELEQYGKTHIDHNLQRVELVRHFSFLPQQVCWVK